LRSELSVRLTGPPEVARLLVPEAVNDWSSVVFRLTAIDVVMKDRIANSPIPFVILSLPVPISQVRKIFRSPVSRHLQDEQIKVECPHLRSANDRVRTGDQEVDVLNFMAPGCSHSLTRWGEQAAHNAFICTLFAQLLS